MDVQKLRDQFAGLDSATALFDNAGGSQTLRTVVRRISAYFDECNVQHGASYARSRRAVGVVAEARGAMATWFNANDPSEVVLGSSTTQLVRNLAHSIGETIEPGDEIIVTDCDHEANIGPWMELERWGAKVRVWEVDREDLSLHLDTLEALMNERTRLVAWTHASNVIGRIHPAREIAAFVRDRGALSCVDGVAYAPHRAVDVRDLGVDFYLSSLYKVFGPHISVLVARRDVLLGLPRVNHFFIGDDELPYKLQPGNANYELSASLLGLWDYVAFADEMLGNAGGRDRAALERVFSSFAAREAALAEQLLAFLRSCDGVRILGPVVSDAGERVATVSFVVEGRSSEDVVLAVDEANVAIRFGDFYAYRLIDALGLRARQGVVRVSLLHYNTEAEVDRLIAALAHTL